MSLEKKTDNHDDIWSISKTIHYGYGLEGQVNIPIP